MNRFKKAGWSNHSLYFNPQQWERLKAKSRDLNEPISEVLSRIIMNSDRLEEMCKHMLATAKY